MLHLYGFGCAIDSMVPIPGAWPRTHEPGAGDRRITVTLHDAVPPAAPGPESFGVIADGISYDAPAVGRFDCRGNAIAITPVVGADPALLGALLVANALPALLWQHGAFLLHAATFQPAGRSAAVAVCGPSGSGKSMIAEQWIAAGARLVSDDVLALGGTGDAATGSGLGNGLHLPRDASGSRRHMALLPEQGLAACRLGAIVVLDRLPADAAAVFSRLSGVAALEAILGQRHRPVVATLLGIQSRVLEQASDLVRTIPVWRWARPEGRLTVDAAERANLLALMDRPS